MIAFLKWMAYEIGLTKWKPHFLASPNGNARGFNQQREDEE